VEGLIRLGFEPASSDVPVIAPPPCDVFERIGKLEDSLEPLPEALKASMCEIGGVCLLGDCPQLALHYHGGPPSRAASMPPGADYPDPLCLPAVDSMEVEVDERLQNAEELLPNRSRSPLMSCTRPISAAQHTMSGCLMPTQIRHLCQVGRATWLFVRVYGPAQRPRAAHVTSAVLN
jgi:hypothetical protein